MYGPSLESIIPLFFIIVAVLIIVSLKAAAKRRQELFALAYQLGLTFNHDDPFDIPNLYDNFSCISKGHNRNAYNVLYGRIDNYDVKIFDFRYKTGSGKNESTHHLSAMALDIDVQIPSLNIRPENVFDRIAGAIGFDDIDFESEEFSRAFYVKSKNKKFAYDVIHQKMMEFLLANKRWCIETHNLTIMITDDRILSPDQIPTAIQFAKGFLALFPEYLWQNLRNGQEYSQ